MNEATRIQPLERPLPHSTEAERAILGAIILDNALLHQAAELLSPADFYVRAHYSIFSSMLSMSEREEPLQPILIGEELKRTGLYEQAGGIVFINELTFGLPRLSDLSHYVNIVREKSARRLLKKTAYKLDTEASEEDGELEETFECAEQALVAIREEYASPRSKNKFSLVNSFADFMSKDFADGEVIAWDACRGEISLVQSITNHGKSTIVRNFALALATGGALSPIVELGQPRRVLLLNLEGSGGRFQSDLRLMTRDFTPGEMALVRENLFPVHRPLLRDGQLSLPRHMRLLEREARKRRVDVIIIDTASKAFALRNENDNAEVANSVMKPLDDLACKLNCLIVLVHHIGKAKSEEGAAREQAHRGRGASAWADFSSSIFNLEAEVQDQTRVTLTCGKRKNGGNYGQVLRLDRESRWFSRTEEATPRRVTNDDLVLEAMQSFERSEIQTGEIEKKLAGKVKRRTLMDCLSRLADLGQIESRRRGWWSLVELCADCASPIGSCTTCTNCAAKGETFPEFDLAEKSHVASNGNGLKGGTLVRERAAQ